MSKAGIKEIKKEFMSILETLVQLYPESTTIYPVKIVECENGHRAWEGGIGDRADWAEKTINDILDTSPYCPTCGKPIFRGIENLEYPSYPYRDIINKWINEGINE